MGVALIKFCIQEEHYHYLNSTVTKIEIETDPTEYNITIYLENEMDIFFGGMIDRSDIELPRSFEKDIIGKYIRSIKWIKYNNNIIVANLGEFTITMKSYNYNQYIKVFNSSYC